MKGFKLHRTPKTVRMFVLWSARARVAVGEQTSAALGCMCKALFACGKL